jgi:hypothetical protein
MSTRPHVGREGYVGEDVYLAARIAAAGHSGQVLASQATRALVAGELADLGLIEAADGNPERALTLCGQSAAIAREVDFTWWEVNMVDALAETAYPLATTAAATSRPYRAGSGVRTRPRTRAARAQAGLTSKDSAGAAPTQRRGGSNSSRSANPATLAKACSTSGTSGTSC